MKLASLVNLKPLKEGSMQARDLASQYAIPITQGRKDNIEGLASALGQIYMDMGQNAEPEGGPVADQFADDIHTHEEAAKLLGYRLIPTGNYNDPNKGIEIKKIDSGGGMTYDDMLRRRDQEKSSGAKDIDWDWRKHTGGIHESTSLPSKEQWDGNEEGQLGVSNLYDLPPNEFNKRVDARMDIISKLGKENKAEAWAYKSWSFLFRPDGGKLSESYSKIYNEMKVTDKDGKDVTSDVIKKLEKQGLKFTKGYTSDPDLRKDDPRYTKAEGSCGYGPDGVPGDTPGGTVGMDADKRTRGMLKKLIQKEVKKLTIGKPPITK